MYRQVIFRLSLLFLLFPSPLLTIAQEIDSMPARPVEMIQLNYGWKFRYGDQHDFLPATVPGTIHTDLMKAGLTPDPWYRDNELQAQYIEGLNCEYQCEVFTDEKLLSRKNVRIRFNGLDTYASVFLNGNLLFEADNMFRVWEADIRHLLKPGMNQLVVKFESSVTKARSLAKLLPYTLPGEEKVFVRKAQYQFGWDWGPRLVTSGIWRPVEILAWDEARLKNVFIHQQKFDPKETILGWTATVNVSQPGNYQLLMKDLPSGKRILLLDTALTTGTHEIEKNFTLINPELWWPNGMGEPALYHFMTELKKSDVVIDRVAVKTGIRQIDVFQTNDKGPWSYPLTAAAGKSFYFKINGVPLFIRGANYIPPDNFMPRVGLSYYNDLTDQAVLCNMNMVRVWGGGQYEDDAFYDLCDEKGIMVWQDFMFACAMYPGDQKFLSNVRQEAIDNVIRLRNHACLALWCGNNEIDEGWKNWGWQKQYHYSAADSAKIWRDYRSLFHYLLPEVLSLNDPGRFYWPSSPEIGWGHPESLMEGDSHYWGVWWGMEPFEVFDKKIGRFISEYGFQGFPDLKTIESFTLPQDRHLESPVLKVHQKHPKGFETIQAYMERAYRQPKDFEQYVYVSQLLQAGGIRKAIDAHRSNQPYCMGTLYWQLNDCWPVISWSGMDVNLRWKALQYTVKDAYQNVYPVPYFVNNTLSLRIVNDSKADEAFDVKLEVIDFTGRVFSEFTSEKPIIVGKNSMESFTPDQKRLIPKKKKFGKHLVNISLIKEGEIFSSRQYYFLPPKELSLPKAVIDPQFIKLPGGIEISLLSDNLAKNIWLRSSSPDACFSDNYFDLLPGVRRKIFCKTALDVNEFKKVLKISSLRDSY